MKIPFKLILLLLFVAFLDQSKAASVDTASVFSASMDKYIKAVVIKPDQYNPDKKFPVLYLLHGFSGSYKDWVQKDIAIGALADKFGMIIVCPDGDFASWYFDSVVKKGSMYETYISRELVNWIDKHYSTIADRKGRAITGLSMGGHGALFIAFRHLNIFGAAGSMSGGVDLRPFSDSFGLDQVLGKYSEHPERWEQSSVINMLYLLQPNSLSITFDCGYDDFFFRYNNALHEKMLEMKIPHDYTVRPGGHTWEYWTNSLKYQALFFSNFFNSSYKKTGG